MMFSKTAHAAICLGMAGFALEALHAAPQTLLKHVPSAVNESRRAGPVAETGNLTLAIGLPLRNSQELDILAEQIADPHSANYQQYLNSAEFAERFGPTQEDYDKLTAFLQGNGFTIAGKHSNRMLLDVTGPVGAINRTLHINLTLWDHPTRGRFFAPDRDPTIDTEVQVLSIAGLDNFVVPQPMDLKVTSLTSAAPLVTGSGPSGLFIGNDFRAAYAPGVTMTGSGQKIGLVEFDGFYPADVVSNFKQAGLPAVPVSTVLLDGFSGSPGGDNIEVILDIVMAGYMAPGASVIVYEGDYPDDVLNRMATDNSAKQLSCSWGYGIDSTTEQIFKQMIVQGQSFFTASGDSGAYSNGVMPPADDPNVTSVGGTALTTTGPGGTWVSESAWSGSGGGVSTTYPIPSYQLGVNMAAIGGSATMRNMPDVALTGAVQMFLIYNNGSQTAVGGTSAATPLWTAFTALANQQAAANSKPVIGFLNPSIYAIGENASNYAAALHDITSGSNGFSAVAGYDLSTGWGSPKGQALINDLASPSTTPSFTLTATPNPATVQAGASVTSTIQVTAVNGFSAAVTLSLSGLPTGVTGSFGALTASKASILTLTATSATTPGTYPVTVNGVSGTLAASVALSVVVTAAPGFTLSTSAASVSLVQGASATASLSIVPKNGFSGAVALTASGLPAGVTATFSPASATAASTLTFAATSTATTGAATVTITGKSGTLASTVAIALTIVPPASFSLSTSTATPAVTQGATATSTITVTPKTGFTNAVTLTASGLPAGVTAAFNPASTKTTSTLTFTATSTATVGTNTVTVTGTYGATSASVALTLTVKAGARFTLSAAPSSLSVVQGASGSTTITVTPVNGFTGTPALSVGGLPGGVVAAFSGTTLKLTATASAAITSSTLTISGTSGGLSAQASLAFSVTPASSFKLASSASNVSVAAGGTGKTTITIAPQGGFSGTVALTASGLPTGVTASFSPASTASTSTLTLTATSAAAAKASTFTVAGTSGSLTSSLSLTVTVGPSADFSLALAPASLHIVQGGRGTAAISLTALNGFAGAVNISASSLPAGVTAAFTTANSGLLMELTAAGTAAAGTSSIDVTAASGSLTHTAILTLTVIAPTTATSAVDLSPYYNVAASAVDGLPFTNGGLDGGGRSYSGMLLGASQTVAGVLYNIGPMGLLDAASGETVTLPAGQFSSLKMLATGVNGNQTAQTFVVTYSDGSTTTFTQNVSDWFMPQNYSGETQALTMSYRDFSTGGTDNEVFHLYGYSLTLNSAKTVRSVALPKNRNVVVLAITLTGATTSAATALPVGE